MKKLLSILICFAVLFSITPAAAISAYAAPVVTGIAFTKADATIGIGETYSNPAVTTPSGGKIAYTSGNTRVATVDAKGKVLGITAGTAVITARSGTLTAAKTATYTVTVTGSGVLKTSRVRINASQQWVRVNRSILLDVSISPSNYTRDYYLEWYTLDNDLVAVDDSGEVTGLKPGIATIAVNVSYEGAARQVDVGYAEIQIEVRDAITTAYSFDESKYDPDNRSVSASSKVSTSSKAGTETAKNDIVPTKTVNEAVKKALKAGTTTSASFRNYKSVSTVSLESAAAEIQLGGGMVLLNFDTYSEDGKTAEGRLTINPRAYKPVKYDDPLQVGHSINVTLNVNDDAVEKVRNKFQKTYKNEILVIKAGQSGGYGMNVTGVVKTGTVFAKAKQANLCLYTYDPERNKFRLMKNSNISIDNNKNLNFTTDTGNYLIISNGPLAKK